MVEIAARGVPTVDAGRALGSAARDLVATLRGDVPPMGEPGSPVDVLAAHALVPSVRACAVCLVDGVTVRVAGVAGDTGDVALGSAWDLRASPLRNLSAASRSLVAADAGSTRLGRALRVGEGELLVTELHAGRRAGEGAPSSGALLLVRDRADHLPEASRTFLDDLAALMALALLDVSPAAKAASDGMASFLNLVVHDLRAPLTVLSGYVDLLRDGTFGDGPPAWDRPLETISAKLSETNRLVDDLLLAARLESGAVPVSLETVDLDDVIVRAARRSEPRAALASAVIEVAPARRPVAVAADVFHVDRIVDNLVNNAMTYGGHSPWIRLSIDDSQPPAVLVEDHGMGISPEHQSRIFDRFFRVDQRIPGTGFGLHVGRVLAQACGGSLRLERSTPGEGSLFRLELPRAQAA